MHASFPSPQNPPHHRVRHHLVTTVDQPQFEGSLLEQVDHAQRHGHPAKAGGQPGEQAKLQRGLGAQEGRQVEGHHQVGQQRQPTNDPRNQELARVPIALEHCDCHYGNSIVKSHSNQNQSTGTCSGTQPGSHVALRVARRF